LNFLISAIGDSTLLIALTVVTVLVGKPLSYLDCLALSNSDSTGATGSFITSVSANLKKNNYWVWAGANKTSCLEVKAVWGFSVALCVLFAFSIIVAMLIWNQERQKKAAGEKIKDIEG
jgi:membrane glycosyltransferase